MLSDFNLDVWNGSIVGILGTSGSGKTTALRLIAGFEKPDEGVIEMRNQIISSNEVFVAPEERNVGMVFQDYALFPHLDVKKNISFGLSKNEINVDVYDLLGNHIIHKENAKEIDMSNFSQGIYDLRITFKGMIINHKVIKQWKR